MTYILCCDDSVHGQGLGCQNDVAIQSLGISGWHSASPGICPELRGFLHDRRSDRQIRDRALEEIEPGEPPHLVAAEKLAPDLIVDDLRQAEPDSAGGLLSHPFTAFAGNLHRLGV